MMRSCPTLSGFGGDGCGLSRFRGVLASTLESFPGSVFRVSQRLLMVMLSSSHWLSLLLRNNSRAFMPRKLLELGSEPTVVGMLVEGSPMAVSHRLLNGPALWLGGFSGVESSLLLLLLPPAPLPPLLPRVLPGLGVLVSPLWPDASSLCPTMESEQPSLQQSSLLRNPGRKKGVGDCVIHIREIWNYSH